MVSGGFGAAATGPIVTTLPENKSEIVAEIASLLGVEAPAMSSGSTEPKTIFILVIERLGLGIDTRMTKPDLARGIVRASGQGWDPDFESRGGTITKAGLLAVLTAVEFWMGAPARNEIEAEFPSHPSANPRPRLAADSSKTVAEDPPINSWTAAARGLFITHVAQNLDPIVQRFGLRRRGAVNIRRGGVFYTLPQRLEIAEFIVARVVSAAHFVDVGFYVDHFPERSGNWKVADLLRHTYGPLLVRYGLQIDTWHGSGAGVKRDRIITRLPGGYVNGDPDETASTAGDMLVQWTRMLLEHPIKGVAAAVRAGEVEEGASGMGVKHGGLSTTQRSRSGTPTLLYLHGVFTTAEGQDEERGFLVYEGARARRQERVMIPGYAQLRRELVENGTLTPVSDVQYHLTRDYYFDSPSAAASILSGGSMNGRKEWKSQSGLTLKELQERAVPTIRPNEREDHTPNLTPQTSSSPGSPRSRLENYGDSILGDLQNIRDYLTTVQKRCRELDGGESAIYRSISNASDDLGDAIRQVRAWE